MRKVEAWFYTVLIAVGILAVVVLTIKVEMIDDKWKDDVKFSLESGVYDKETTVTLSARKQGEIRFTLDGDTPTISSQKYDKVGGIKMTLAGEEGKTVVYPLKVTLCNTQTEECGPVYMRTYVLNENPEEYMDLEVISVTSAHENLYDYEIGIMVDGKMYDQNAENAKPGEWISGNWGERDDEWVRDAEVASFAVRTGKKIWEQEIGIQISGGTSARLNPKSLKLVGKKSMGYTNLKYDFGESGSASDALQKVIKYKSLRLRVGGQDMNTGNVRSAVVSRLAEESGFDGYSATKRALVFLNGEYYAIADVEQNFSGSFLANRFGLKDGDLIEKYKGSEKAVFKDAEITELFEADLTKKGNREKLEAAVDMEDYLWYYALELLWNNTDWPDNSYEIWRWKGEVDESNKYTDGRWRFLVYDTDLIYYTEGNARFFDGAVSDQIENVMEGKHRGAGSMFTNVMEVEEYRERFTEIIKYLTEESAFKTENVEKIVKEEAEKIRRQVKIYAGEEGYENWEEQINLLLKAVKEREEVLETDFRRYFGI